MRTVFGIIVLLLLANTLGMSRTKRLDLHQLIEANKEKVAALNGRVIMTEASEHCCD